MERSKVDVGVKKLPQKVALGENFLKDDKKMMSSDQKGLFEDELFVFFQELIKLSVTLDVDLKIPTLVLTGLQSAGKTSFIEILCGIPIGFKQRETATRCPVRYILRTNDHSSDFLVKVLAKESEKIMQIKDLINYIQNHMNLVKEKKKFSEKELTLEISGPNLPNLVFIDLPGLIPNPKDEEIEDSVAIKALVSNFLKNSNCYPIIMLKCTEDFSTNVDIGFMKRFLLENGLEELFGKSIFVLNQIDRFIKDFKDVADFGLFLDKIPEDLMDKLCLVSLNPKGIIVSDLDSNSLKRHIQNVSVEENRLFSEKFNVSSLAELNKKLGCEMIGLYESKKMVKRKFIEILKENLLLIKNKFEVIIYNEKQGVEELRQKLEMADPEIMRKKYLAFSTDLIEHMKGLQTLKNVKDVNFKNVTNFDIEAMYNYLPARYGQSFEDVMELAPNTEWDFVLKIDTLYAEDQIGNDEQFVYEMCKNKLVGLPNYDRLRLMFNYFLVNKGFESYSEDDIRCMLFENGLQEPNVKHAVITMASTQLYRSKPGIQWYLETLSRIIKRDLEHVLDYLFTSKYYSNIKNDNLTNTIIDDYLNHFSNQFNKIKMRWNESVELYSCEIDTDISVRTLLYYLSCPLEAMIPTNENYVINNYSDGYKPKTDVQKQGKYLSDEKPEVEYVPNGRNLAKLDALIEIRAVVKSFNKVFNIADCLEGGYQSTGQMEKSMIDYSKIKNMAKEYYMMIMIRFIHDFDSSFKKYFKCYILEESQTILTKDFTTMIIGLNTDQLSTKYQDNTGQIQEQIKQKELNIKETLRLQQRISSFKLDQLPKKNYQKKKKENPSLIVDIEPDTSDDNHSQVSI